MDHGLSTEKRRRAWTEKHVHWNRVLCLHSIWLLFSESESLWAQWHRHHQSNVRSFWAVEEASMDSWVWKQLLKLRQEGIKFIKPILASGRRISFWYDVWTPFGQLIHFQGQCGPYQLRVPINGLVADACSLTAWSLPPPRSDKTVELHIFLTSIQCPAYSTVADTYEWTTSTKLDAKFSALNNWQDMHLPAPVQPVAETIWFKGAIPRNSFNMWIASLNRFLTRARLAGWGLQINTA
uniref:Reverse transcriptase zinc-binding domain-containing protein n=1 Tax=Brassica oleracea var. oleracea TaxID=109376 RepID=A0A0D3EB43_BRAOL